MIRTASRFTSDIYRYGSKPCQCAAGHRQEKAYPTPIVYLRAMLAKKSYPENPIQNALSAPALARARPGKKRQGKVLKKKRPSTP